MAPIVIALSLAVALLATDIAGAYPGSAIVATITLMVVSATGLFLTWLVPRVYDVYKQRRRAAQLLSWHDDIVDDDDENHELYMQGLVAQGTATDQLKLEIKGKRRRVSGYYIGYIANRVKLEMGGTPVYNEANRQVAMHKAQKIMGLKESLRYSHAIQILPAVVALVFARSREEMKLEKLMQTTVFQERMRPVPSHFLSARHLVAASGLIALSVFCTWWTLSTQASFK